MSIAVTTIVGDNYGSALQTYALQRAFSEYGDVQSYVMILKPRSVVKNFIRTRVLPNKVYSFKSRISKLNSDVRYRKKRRAIRKFYNKMISQKEYYSIHDLAAKENNTKVLVSGSDQVWNPYLGFAPLRYLTFVENKSSKKFSYAASIGVSQVEDKFKLIYASKLADFEKISIREKTGKQLLEEIMPGSVIREDLDPVLLFGKDFWQNISSDRFVGQDYIFVYMLRPQPELLDLAIKVGQKYNKKVYYIGEHYFNKKNLITVTDAGVEDFLSCIANASLVLTNSFHATAFSVIFNKQFSSVVISRTGSRVEDFLKMVNLENRIQANFDEMDNLFMPIEFSRPTDIIESRKRESIEYIKEIALTAKG